MLMLLVLVLVLPQAPFERAAQGARAPPVLVVPGQGAVALTEAAAEAEAEAGLACLPAVASDGPCRLPTQMLLKRLVQWRSQLMLLWMWMWMWMRQRASLPHSPRLC